ncbi:MULTISPECIES: hypothetical protein [Sphingopyxis]|uniref:hypothetical protein n=1 Tax=Sphingopyxis TaxID=165697 RepID=UPI000831F228|nr:MULTISPECIES: hypothetical protein [Sphingopyxis]
MDTEEFLRRLHCWAAALKRLMSPPGIENAEKSTCFASGEELNEVQIASLAFFAAKVSKPLVYLTWDRSFGYLPLRTDAFLPKTGAVELTRGLIPWTAGQGRPVILVEAAGDNAYAMKPNGRLRKCLRPTDDLDAGMSLALDLIRAAAAEIDGVVLQARSEMSKAGKGRF